MPYVSNCSNKVIQWVYSSFNERPKQDETVNSLIAYFKTKNRESLKAKSE